MQYMKLASFNGLINGGRATAEIPSYRMSLGRIVLNFGGSITKALISEIVVKIGSRVIFGPISGAQLDTINKYKGIFDSANFLSIDLTERDGLSIFAKEVGAIDLPSLGGERVFVEVVNSASAGTPQLEGMVGFTGLQFKRDGKGMGGAANDTQEQLVHKLLKFTMPQAGSTRQVWLPNMRGAEIKRVHFFYTGTDWTGTANGNLYQVDVKRNGVSVHDRITCLQNRFIQQEQRKVPQSRVYTYDPVHDDTHSNMLKTAGVTSLEFILDLTAGDTVTAFVECLDLPRNL